MKLIMKMYINVRVCCPESTEPTIFQFQKTLPLRTLRQGRIFFCLPPPPPSKYGKCHVGGKKLLKGDEKGGKCMFFPNWLKYEYFFPNWLNIYKITKILNIFACGAHYLIIINFLWGKIWIKKGGGGITINFKFNNHPCSEESWNIHVFKILLAEHVPEFGLPPRRSG